MKTLNEQIEEVMNERGTKAAKREKLLKIGITNNDIEQLFFVERQIAKRNRAEQGVERRRAIDNIISRYTFGVEIECYAVNRQDVINKAAAKGLTLQSENYNHRTRPHYKLVNDASIMGANPVECVSPVLKGKRGLNSLKKCCEALNEVGAMVNKTTGLHIHVGGNITEQQYVNTFSNYVFLEKLIDTFMADSRKNNRFAKSLQPMGFGLYHSQNRHDIKRVLMGDRYYKVNCLSIERHGTIEFRQHQGTTDYEKISYWAKFCIKLVDWSKQNRLTAYVASIDEIPFLSDSEKAYFKARAEHFANNR
mgnify:CR=1 FL=1